LGLPERIRAYLEPEQSLPAAGQGAMAIEVPTNRPELIAYLQPLNHIETAQAVFAERAISKAFGGSCQIPLAAFAQIVDGQMNLRAMIASPDGLQMARGHVQGAASDFLALGQQVVQQLEQANAMDILQACKQEAVVQEPPAHS
jgi:hydroxymethylbilane synthase